MRKKYLLEEKRKIIIDYIKKNPNTTYKNIRKNLKLHPERIFSSFEDAFKMAEIKPPRTFKIKTKEEKRKIIIDYIKKHQKVGWQTIKKDTKINFQTIFKNTKEAFNAAGVAYSRDIDKRNKEEKKEEIIKTIRENPLINIEELTKKVKTQPYHLFKNIEEIYKEAGIKLVKKEDKWRLKKQQEVINYIKQNQLATQREINKVCKTHVQVIFNKGIFEAYEKADIKFPYERLRFYGIGLKEIRDRAKNFEDEISIKLSGYGKVNRLVKTKRGFADIIFERNDKKAIIEIKDYKDKEISISQINQLNKYLEDCNCKLGFLICHDKPKKYSFLINENKIFVLNSEELNKIPIMMQGI